jgi:hypothetical protein
MQRSDLARLYPVLYHMAEDGTWPSLRAHGLLSTRALVDLFAPDDAVRAQVLNVVRKRSVAIESDRWGRVVVRDQAPLKFLEQCLTEGTTVQEYLDALNERVFFWLSLGRLQRLLGARRYRNSAATVLHVDTARLLARHGDTVQLAPCNTGSVHVPTLPRRGTDVFVDVDRYPHDTWRAKRGPSSDAVVELTVKYQVKDIVDLTQRVERWAGGQPVEVLYTAKQ